MLDAAPVYRSRDLPAFVGQGFLTTTAMQVQSVAIGWQIYDIERTPLALGLVGLCQFVRGDRWSRDTGHRRNLDVAVSAPAEG